MTNTYSEASMSRPKEHVYALLCKKTEIDGDSRTIYIAPSVGRSLDYITGPESAFLIYGDAECSSFSQEECCLCLSPFVSGNYVEAYPKFIGLEEIARIFPMCSQISLRGQQDFCFDDLVPFRNLISLEVTLTGNSLNGIEFLDSLKSLVLRDLVTEHLCQLNNPTLETVILIVGHTGRINLSYLNLPSLINLVVEAGYVEDTVGCHFPNLESLKITAKSIEGLDRCHLPNIKRLKISGRLKSIQCSLPSLRCLQLRTGYLESIQGDFPSLEKLEIPRLLYILATKMDIPPGCSIVLTDIEVSRGAIIAIMSSSLPGRSITYG